MACVRFDEQAQIVGGENAFQKVSRFLIRFDSQGEKRISKGVPIPHLTQSDMSPSFLYQQSDSNQKYASADSLAEAKRSATDSSKLGPWTSKRLFGSRLDPHYLQTGGQWKSEAGPCNQEGPSWCQCDHSSMSSDCMES